MKFKFEPGTKCTINTRQPMYDITWRPWVDQPCVIVKRTKAGLIQVAKISDPKATVSVPQENITTTNDLQDKIFELNELTDEQMCQTGLMEAIVEEIKERASISIGYKKERDEASTVTKIKHFQKKLVRNNEEAADLIAALERVSKARSEHGTIDNVEDGTENVSKSKKPTS